MYLKCLDKLQKRFPMPKQGKKFISIYMSGKKNLVLEVTQRHGDADSGGGRIEHFLWIYLDKK